MSEKCCSTAGTMLTSRDETPKVVIKSTALSCVRSVVPNPGMVTPIIPFLSSPRASNVLEATNRAKVESNPPKIPIVRDFVPVTLRRWARPEIWILIISSQRSSIRALLAGTKGCGATCLIKSVCLFSVAGRVAFTVK